MHVMAEFVVVVVVVIVDILRIVGTLLIILCKHIYNYATNHATQTHNYTITL